MKFVVIGGDGAGMSAASKARRNYSSIDITVLEKTPDVSYSACGMPYNLPDPERLMDDLIVRSPDVFRNKMNIDLRLGHEVETIVRAEKRIIGRSTSGNFEVHYDKLLIATGARARKMTVPGSDLDRVVMLRSLQDGREIKRRIFKDDVKSVLIIGAGYIGLEMAEAFVELGIRVEVGDIRTELLPWMPLAMSKIVEEELKSHGVIVSMGMEVCGFEDFDGKVKVIRRQDEIVVDLVLVAVGVDPVSELAKQSGLDLSIFRSIAVNKYLHTSDPDIFSAGDCADAFHAITGQRVWIPLALRANRSGWIVADNLFEDKEAIPDIIGTSVFKVLDLEVARTGLSLGEAEKSGFEPIETYIKSRSRAHAHPGNQDIYVHLVADKNTGKLLGANLVGKEGAAHRINSLAVALHSGMTVREFYNCDLAYAPPFSPVWDPMLMAAKQLLKLL